MPAAADGSPLPSSMLNDAVESIPYPASAAKKLEAPVTHRPIQSRRRRQIGVPVPVCSAGEIPPDADTVKPPLVVDAESVVLSPARPNVRV